jgi:hypothetical protein
MKTIREAKFRELQGLVEDLMQKMGIMAKRAERGEYYSPTIGPLATEIDCIQAQLRLLDNPYLQEVYG